MKGRIKQSVSRWCYESIPLEGFCGYVRDLGLSGIDLLDPPDWPVVKANGLEVTMATGPGSIEDGWNDPRNHDALAEKACERLYAMAEAGVPNIIVFSGNRRGMPDDAGRNHCVQGLKRILPLAEKLGVNVMMELLNSKRDHKDYMCDHTAWGVALAETLCSERFKLIYDIYHMQIMEGDVIETLREHMPWIGHIHTGGVPGRNEIDDSQELNYRRICGVIAESGFTGYVAHEFIPTREPIGALRDAAMLCDV